ncbi:MAG: site-2 protease family protein [Actinomycetota bacterium]|nr:site-2 protease family protein [Actinomycetota bacterium]MCL6092897.1 site-2 protease family protein [Actinomycetota bacterium]MDA8166469.1 site-2 protease family protein [Actinomycetota bacterium]
MKWSFKVGSAFGIELRIHLTFFLILVYAAFIWGSLYGEGIAGAFYGSLVIIALFVCVVIHELCHSKMAQHYGGEVSSITLLPIGGVSMMKKMPEEPTRELLVSLVGPLSNLVIAVLLVPVLYLIPNPVDGAFGAFSQLANHNSNVLVGISLQGFVSYMFFINILLAVFNLLPAFPLDGGRVFRSILAQRMSYARATHTAVLVGQIFAFALGLIGVLTLNIIFIIIAIFIYMGAEQEGAGSEMKDILSRLNVGDAVARDTKTLAPGGRLGDVVTLVLHELQEDFPVQSGDKLVGVLTRANLISGLHGLGPDGLVEQVMEKDFPVVAADAPFSEVYEKMNETRIRAVPVMKDGHLLGMVTLEHLSEVFMLLTATDRPIIPSPSH